MSHIAGRSKRLKPIRALPVIRVTLDHDPNPDLSWLDQWDTPDKYKGNEIIGRNGKPLSFEEYRRSYGDPRKHVTLCALVERQCNMGEWHAVDSLGGIDFLADETDTWTTGTFYNRGNLHGYTVLSDRVGLRSIVADLIRQAQG